MRTIIFATQKHIDFINEYKAFLAPFYKDENVVFCPWNISGNSLDDCAPDLYKCLQGTVKWRAIILCDDENAQKKLNPFDLVGTKSTASFSSGSEDVTEYQREYYNYMQKVQEDRLAAYETACTQPLTRLSTYLCQLPLETNQLKEEDQEFLDKFKEDVDSGTPVRENYGNQSSEGSDLYDFDPPAVNHEAYQKYEFILHKILANRKQELRLKMVEGSALKAHYPESVICISLRNIDMDLSVDSEKADLTWKSHSEVQYSQFCDWNMYFERMRFFAYDILPADHVNYRLAYLQFVYTLMIFSNNDLPSGVTTSERLYTLKSSCNEEKLRNMVATYQQKLENTVGKIHIKEKEILDDVPQPLSDSEAEKAFHSRYTVSVKLPADFDYSEMFPETEDIGLSNNCPTNETVSWNRKFFASNKTMLKLFKQPRRALEKATEELRYESVQEEKRFRSLNHFQIDDIREYVDNEENEMVSIKTDNFYDVERYEKRVLAKNQEVEKVLETRMSKKVTLILGVVALAAFLIGFLPILFFNENVISIPIPFLLTAFTLAILGVSGFICLFKLRKELIDSIDEYNDEMSDIKADVDNSMHKFSDYLSRACHVLKGNYILNVALKQEDGKRQRICTLEDHIDRIRDKQIAVGNLFGEYSDINRPAGYLEFYDYDYDKPEKYDFPVPFTEDTELTIPYLQDLDKITVPFDFIEQISIQMEDLYG